MKTLKEFEGYLIPEQYLKEIKGGIQWPPPFALGVSFCPLCGSRNIISTLNIPPVSHCKDCRASWRVWEYDDYWLISAENKQIIIPKDKVDNEEYNSFQG